MRHFPADPDHCNMRAADIMRVEPCWPPKQLVWPLRRRQSVPLQAASSRFTPKRAGMCPAWIGQEPNGHACMMCLYLIAS